MGAFFPDQMDEYCYYYNANNSKRNHVVPPFGSWDNYDDHDGGADTAAFPFTQCFETAGHNYQYHHHQPPPPPQDSAYDLYDYGKINNRRRVHSFEDDEEEKDLYVAGDLYQNDVFTPAVIVVPRRRPRTTIKRGNPSQKPNNNNKKQHHHHHQNWVAGQDLVLKQPPVNTNTPPRRSSRRSKDEDLYKIPSHLLHSAPKRKRGFGLFSSCMLPACV